MSVKQRFLDISRLVGLNIYFFKRIYNNFNRRGHFMNKNFAIFGDCVSQGIVDDREHTRALGFTNWCSLLSHSISDNRIISEVDSISTSAYSIRNLKLDLQKNALKYLLEEKADYLIIDPNDCRMQLAQIEDYKNVYTISASGGELYEKIKNKFEVKKINAGEISVEKYEEAAKEVCKKILDVYDPSQIIIHIHKFVDEYTDGNRILKLNNEKYPARNKKCQDIMNYMYGVLQREFKGFHVINFPEQVLGDSRHRFGLCGLHYHKLYDEYGKAAIKIICEQHSDEKMLLEQLRDKYSLKFQLLRNEIESKYQLKSLETRINNIVNSVGREYDINSVKSIFRNITDIREYFDLIKLYKKNIGIVVAVRDTSGFKRESNYFDELHNIGFKHYPEKLWYTYCGFILKGVEIVDKTSDKAEIPTTWNGEINNHVINLESHSWRKLNTSKIIIDGVDYSSNQRGANIVVIDAESFEVIDSVVYDMHEIQDYFRRIKKFERD